MLTFLLCLLAFGVSILTFFSGFGLGTLLTPAFMAFFPADVAIALTGVVHFFNNLFKLVLVGRHADRTVLLRFGLPAVLAAGVGAALMVRMAHWPTLYTYTLGEHTFHITPIKAIVSILLILFALWDVLPALRAVEFDYQKLPLGGLLSGFFGGLSGNQGALRSAFLRKVGLSKTGFVGTAVVVSTFVDLTRLGVYASRFVQTGLAAHWHLVIAATLSAIAGAYVGNRLLEKVTLQFVQHVVTVMLIIVAIALGLGLL